MLQLRFELVQLRKELHLLNHMVAQEGSGEDEESIQNDAGDSERSFKSLPAPEASRKAQMRKGSEPAQELGKRKTKKKRKRRKEEEPAKPEDGVPAKDVDPSPCNGLEEDESADVESDSLSSFFGTVRPRSDRSDPEPPEPPEPPEVEVESNRKVRSKCGIGPGCCKGNNQCYRGPH